MAKTINQIFYETYAQGALMDVPHRARLYPQPMPMRPGKPGLAKPILVKPIAGARRACGQALIRLAAALGTHGQRLAEG